MTQAFDQRLMTITITTELPLPNGAQGPVQQDALIFKSTADASGLDMRCHGRLFAGTTMGQADIRISNLTRDQRNAILTRATPIIPVKGNRTPTYVTLDVGRESYGTFRLFEGSCWASMVTDAPDMTLTLSSLTNSIQSSLVQTYIGGLLSTVQTIAQQIATKYGWKLQLVMKNPNQQISNFQYTGSAQNAIQKLADIGGLTVFVSNGALVVMDKSSFIGEPVTINLQNGMVGIPQANEWGVQVKTLLRPDIKLGGAVNIQSITNPAVNGQWWIYQANFDATNRSDPFWYDLYCRNTIITESA